MLHPRKEIDRKVLQHTKLKNEKNILKRRIAVQPNSLHPKATEKTFSLHYIFLFSSFFSCQGPIIVQSEHRNFMPHETAFYIMRKPDVLALGGG